MKSQKTILFSWGIIFLIVLLAALQVEVRADSKEKQWVVIQSQIPEDSTRYSIALKYMPSEETLCSVSQRNIKSVALPENERIDNYIGQIDLGTALDGSKYSVLLGDAHELSIINRDGRQIGKARILRLKQDSESEIVKEGYFFHGNQIEVQFEVSGQQLALPTTESLPGVISINIYGNDPYSYQCSSSTRIKGSLKGSTFTESTSLEVSVTYKESLQPTDRYVNLTVQPLDEKVLLDSTSGKITDVLKLRSAQLVVEKIASDSSEIVLATLHGDISKAKEEWLESHLSVGKPIPPFARVDLFRHKLLTLDELCKKVRSERHIVFIFGDFKRQPNPYECGYRGEQVTSELALDETMILEMLQRDLKYPPVVVFVCRQFSFFDLYEKWLGKDLDFYILADYSSPMDVQFVSASRDSRCYYPRLSTKVETLRGQFVLPEDKVSVLLVNGKGNLEYIKVDAGPQLAASLAEINKLISSKK